MSAAAPITRRHARIIGVVYLLFFLTSILGDRLLKGLVLENDAAATARHLLAHESLFRAGTAMGLASTGFYLALTALFYDFFRPVSRSLSFLAAVFGLAGCALQAGGIVFNFFSLAVLRSGLALPHFTSEQLPDLALVFLKLGDQAVLVALVFFAMYCLLLGCLILRSVFLPRLLGALLVLAGIGWLTFLYQPLADRLSPYIELVGIVAEGLLMLWLLVKGVDVERWRQQAEG